MLERSRESKGSRRAEETPLGDTFRVTLADSSLINPSVFSECGESTHFQDGFF
jgi:hypothetical protein